MEASWWIIAGSLVVIGIAGTVLPALPGIVLVFVGLALAAWIDDFQRVGGATIAILGMFTLLASDRVCRHQLGRQKFGASYKAVAGAAIGTLAGMFFGIPGLIAGPFVGAVLGEYIARPDLYKAGRAGFGAWIGLLFGAAAKLALAFLMVGVFVTALMI